MGSGDQKAQHSHRHSAGGSHRRRSESLKQGRSRQTSVVSKPSVPSLRSAYSSTTVSTSSAHRNSASTRNDPDSPESQASIDSIVDDPFFQQYHAADKSVAAGETATESQSTFLRHESPPPERQPKSVPRKESLTVSDLGPLPRMRDTMESINIAVIGANGVGKSHFVQRAMSLSRTPGIQPSTARIHFDSVPYAVTLFELDLEYFDVDPERQIQWPRQIGGALMPAIHGVLLLYDVMNRDSIIELPQTLNEAGETTGMRRRAASAAHLDKPFDPTGGRPLSQHSKHSRASSDMSLIRGMMTQPGKAHGSPSRSPRINYLGGLGSIAHNAGDEMSVSSMLRTPGIRLDQSNTASFLDIDESDGESRRYSDDIPILQRNDDMSFDRPAKKAGVTFDELVDRLLAAKFSKADANFSDVFLCLYRKFAAPAELFSAILARLDRIKDDKTVHYLTKTSTQLRVIEAVAKWVSSYPTDFARPATRRHLEEFIRHLATEPIFAAAAQEMRRMMDLCVFEDDDAGWAKADEMEAPSHPASLKAAASNNDLHESMSSLSVGEPVDRRPSASSSLNTSLNTESTTSQRFHQFQFHSYDDYEREAVTMVPSYTMPLTKFRYHIFMDTSDDDIADELTRIDWVMFSSIRIRDLVRAVSLNAQQKENSQSMKNVNRMVNHFNHIAKWVANMVLMRDKAKHRAQMLEKFMNIALKLRQLNNYNGLAAILAGINGTAIHRLNQTRCLVSADVQKRFARLVLLMGTQKSHFAYRLAWENSPLPRIPFMPLHRRDLVSAEEGSMTFVGPEGDRINWKKFEVLGEIILPIIKSQGTPYPNLTKHDTARELILDCLMPTDEEDIYQRSIQVETPTGGYAGDGKKKFPWFAKQ
ncbi:uncharacterized protein JN550_002944 [Neoarthrinium moseri]|uniref:uncharacterized protein n=1 Tax=Neoarthrinium moseri TaxID=1658444 RepID=UPI001FDD8738|nr:uncharacterized protein JN550_002944 [Neoarthrinium moseri]KAI1873675.1 hypothetical protein JN550_002944 [Neoarthrinium moseri]